MALAVPTAPAPSLVPVTPLAPLDEMIPQRRVFGRGTDGAAMEATWLIGLRLRLPDRDVDAGQVGAAGDALDLHAEQPLHVVVGDDGAGREAIPGGAAVGGIEAGRRAVVHDPQSA